MAEYIHKLMENFKEEDPTNSMVTKVINTIKNSHDFEGAINLMKKYNLKLEDIASRSIRLSVVDFIILADLMISKKK